MERKELKVVSYEYHNEFGNNDSEEAYLKSEADKVIDELEYRLNLVYRSNEFQVRQMQILKKRNKALGELCHEMQTAIQKRNQEIAELKQYKDWWKTEQIKKIRNM